MYSNPGENQDTATNGGTAETNVPLPTKDNDLSNAGKDKNEPDELSQPNTGESVDENAGDSD